MEHERPVRCSENVSIAAYLLNKRQEMMAKPSGSSDNLDLTLSNAYRSICNAESPITNLKDLYQIKGVGKWILRMLKGFFSEEPRDKPFINQKARNGKISKTSKRYMPQKSSAPYALLITLYRGTVKDGDFMRRQELIDATEASGLSRMSIGPEKGKPKPGQFGTSRDWYTGWSCMKTLIDKGLVAKSGCPAKYMLTEEGRDVAFECLQRSGLVDSADQMTESCGSQSLSGGTTESNLNFIGKDSVSPTRSKNDELKIDFALKKCSKKNTQSCHSQSSYLKTVGPVPVNLSDGNCNIPINRFTSVPVGFRSISSGLMNCSSYDHSCFPADVHSNEVDPSALAMPPLGHAEKFEDFYDLILILDHRERFGSKRVLDILLQQFKVKAEVRNLPLGDGIWISRHKLSTAEFVLDFIVERKNVQDFFHSIKDNRYRDQKLRLQRCGLQKLIYLVEGDPNVVEGSESVKTACFTTEILEGFDVQRSNGLTDTVRRYGHLTQAILQYYNSQSSSNPPQGRLSCPSFDDFIKHCQGLETMTVRDVFALQLMQVPQVTEEAALDVVAMYPTVVSLARAYSDLEGDVQAQEELLKNKSAAICRAASKNIFKLVWSC